MVNTSVQLFDATRAMQSTVYRLDAHTDAQMVLFHCNGARAMWRTSILNRDRG
jgi:hypothetical protein